MNKLKPAINIVTVIQARTESTRLPNKVLLSLAGKPLLVRMIERIKASKLTGTVVVGTTVNKSDDLIYDLCKKESINVYRGHPTDLLDRHYKIGLKYNADVVVKIPSDCPLICPDVITKVLTYYILNQDYFHYVSNLHPPSYPDGNDVEVMSMQALKLAWLQSEKDFEREHTTPYIWENDHIFSLGNVIWERGLNFSMSHRWTIDYEKDYLFIKSVFDELYHINPLFRLYDILNLLDKKPQLRKINQEYCGINWYRNHLHELKSIKPHYTRVI